MGQVAGRPEQHEDEGVRHPLEAEALAERIDEVRRVMTAPLVGDPKLAHRLGGQGRLDPRRFGGSGHDAVGLLLGLHGVAAELVP